MKKQRKIKNRPLSEVERWRNLCDALSEDSLLAETAPPLEMPMPRAPEFDQLQSMLPEERYAADRFIQTNLFVTSTNANAPLMHLMAIDKFFKEFVRPGKAKPEEASSPKEDTISSPKKKD